MAGPRVHILGASGSGTSTLARNLGNRLETQVFDSDDFYWLPSDPPFERKRPARDRIGLMRALFLDRPHWILAGQMIGWGAEIVPYLTHVIFLTMPAGPRLDRLARREVRRYGDAVLPGGERAPYLQSFLDWAACYDDPSFDGRSRRQQEEWLAKLAVPVIRLDALLAPDLLTQAALDALDVAGAGN